MNYFFHKGVFGTIEEHNGQFKGKIDADHFINFTYKGASKEEAFANFKEMVAKYLYVRGTALPNDYSSRHSFSKYNEEEANKISKAG